MSMSWRRLDRLEIFKQLTIFTYPLQTKEGEGWDDQTRDIQTIGLVHVHPREDGQMRGVQTIDEVHVRAGDERRCS